MKGYINLTHTNNGKIEQVKQELIDYINAHDGGEIQIVETLPTASAETYFNDSKTIYMVRNTSTSGDNYYDEYITIRTGEESSYTYSWEHIGSTQIDLSNYVQKTQTIAGVDLQDDITKGELQGALEDSTHRFVSDAEKGDWNGKQNALVSGENIKSINDESVLGAGNLQVGYPVLEGVGEPTGATAGKVNQLYRDTATNKVYICGSVTTENDVTSYEWQAVGGSGKYLHRLCCSKFSGSTEYRIQVDIINDTNSQMTGTDVLNWIYANNFNYSSAYPATGVYVISGSTYGTIVGIGSVNGRTLISDVMKNINKTETITIDNVEQTVMTGFDRRSWSDYEISTTNIWYDTIIALQEGKNE